MIALHEIQVLPDLLRMSAAAYGRAPALLKSGRPETVWSYREIEEMAARGACFLSNRQLAPGESVILFLESGPEWVVGFFALQMAGCVAVPLMADTSIASLPSIAERVGARTVITGKRTKGIATTFPFLREIAVETLLRHPGRLEHPRTRSTEDTALLAFTSGTTAWSKVVELSHGNLLADLRAVLSIRTAGPGDAFLSILPLAHLFELMGGLLGPLACGARIVYEPSVLPNRIVEAFRDEGITHAMAVPGLVECLIDEVRSDLDDRTAEPDRLWDSVRAVIGKTFHTLVVGGAALRADLVAVLQGAGIQIEVGYGLTEAGPIVTLGRLNGNPIGSVGRPLPGVAVRISEQGEVLVLGDNVMRGYFRDPEATRKAFIDGWLRTGDRGFLDAEGRLFLTGRTKDVIITSTGETLDPIEMESHYRHPLFAESCMVGQQGEDGNDVPVLIVVPADAGVEDAEIENVFRRLRSIAPARFRASRAVRRNQPLPRTATGKVRRVELSRPRLETMENESV